MRKLAIVGALLAVAASAGAAPNVTNATQKGSLLIFPDIDTFGDGVLVPGRNTLIRIQNDGSSDIDVKCYWMDGNKNRVDFSFVATRNQAVWFDARTGSGTYQVNRFPSSVANGIDNPYLVGPPFPSDEATDTNGPYTLGMLVCFAADAGLQNQVKWNHLSGTATVYDQNVGAYEYNAYAFFAPTGIDLAPVGVAGVINLNGVEYDSCPLYQIGQFTPEATLAPNFPFYIGTRLALTSCTLDLKQDWRPVWTKYQFDAWNEDEVKFTGAFDCGDSWHEILGFGFDFDSGAFLQPDNFGTNVGRYRVQGVASTKCADSQNVGVLAVQSSVFEFVFQTGTTLAGAGKLSGRVLWDPAGSVPEGGIR